MGPSVDDVKAFWDRNPLFTGEAAFDPINPQRFFDAHDRAYFDDVLVGIDVETVFSIPTSGDRVLDLGCGVGFWSSLFSSRYRVADLTSADLSAKSLEICRLRVPGSKTAQQNAESLTFADAEFSFVNCQGVIHHTPDTDACLREIHRVLKPSGRASISVYYDNVLLKLVSVCLPLARLASKGFLRNKGRGRDFSQASSKDDLVRMYDGLDNPLGKSYSASEFRAMLTRAGFREVELAFFFFPFRFLKVPVPQPLKQILVRLFPFMVVANVIK
ncbi:MAG: class I SAM-dependent methyltransferase [Pseudomonadota bacterium]